MEQHLRCNNQIGGYCRAELTETAVITTCSHIFCRTCAEKTGFIAANARRRTCPVCSTHLPSNDDVVETRLFPSEDYKTSVLSGMDPATVMECASRALAFWTYQTTQEVLYQEHLCKNLADKYTHQSTAMDKLVHEANSEIQTMQNKVTSLSVDQKTLQQKYTELSEAYRDKSGKQKQLQSMYEALKKRFLVHDAQHTASANVDQVLQSIGTNSRPPTYQQQPSLDPLSVYQEGRSERKARSEHSQAGHHSAEARQPSEVSDPHGFAPNMPPPPRPVHGSRIPTTGGSNTPVNRTALPASGRPTANRSQIPTSTSRQESRPQYSSPQVGDGLSSRHQLAASGPINRHSTAIPRGFGGITNGMKIGRAGTAGQMGNDAMTGQHHAHGGYLQRNHGSFDSRYF